MSPADFSDAMKAVNDGLVEHAYRDYPGETGPARVKRAVFVDRGGHAAGEPCPSEMRLPVDVYDEEPKAVVRRAGRWFWYVHIRHGMMHHGPGVGGHWSRPGKRWARRKARRELERYRRELAYRNEEEDLL